MENKEKQISLYTKSSPIKINIRKSRKYCKYKTKIINILSNESLVFFYNETLSFRRDNLIK